MIDILTGFVALTIYMTLLIGCYPVTIPFIGYYYFGLPGLIIGLLIVTWLTIVLNPELSFRSGSVPRRDYQPLPETRTDCGRMGITVTKGDKNG